MWALFSACFSFNSALILVGDTVELAVLKIQRIILPNNPLRNQPLKLKIAMLVSNLRCRDEICAGMGPSSLRFFFIVEPMIANKCGKTLLHGGLKNK